MEIFLNSRLPLNILTMNFKWQKVEKWMKVMLDTVVITIITENRE